MLAVCCPRSALCEPDVGPMFAYVSRMWPQVGPMLALCWPKLALCWPYFNPILPHHVDQFCQTMLKLLQLVFFFPSGAAPEPENHVKRVVFDSAKINFRHTESHKTP